MKNKRYLKKVKSVCPICLNLIEADLIEKNHRVVLSKKCPNHGKFETLHIWDDPWCYKKLEKIFRSENTPPNGILIDLTLNCNLACPFCFSLDESNTSNKKSYKFNEPSIADIVDKVNRFKEVNSFSTIFLFGGEPTLRKDLFKIISELKKLIPDVCLFTNGLRLSDRRYVKKLKKSGVDYVVLQLDSLNKNKNKIMRGKDVLNKKLEALSNLKEERISVDFFTVILKNVNEQDIEEIILLASKNSEVVKNIYISTITYEGRGRYESKFKQLTNSDRLELIESQLGISKQDFLECTVFDHFLSKFFNKLTDAHCKSLAACDMMCYIYSFADNRIVPLNRLINFKTLSEFFEDSLEILDSNKPFKHIEVFYKFAKIIFFGKIFIEPNFMPNFLKSAIASLKPLIKGRPIKNNFDKVFRIIITQFQDRYNLDFDTFRNCNLWSELPNGEIAPFCQKNILHRYNQL